MDKDRVIQEINNTRQKVNEGSKAFRDQIDFNVLPLVKEDVVVTGLVQEARAAWTSADRLTKNWLEQAKVKIQKPTPPTKPMLDPDLHYHKLRKIYSAFFLKGGLTLRTDLPNHPVLKHYPDKAFMEVIDYIADNNISNVIRVIGPASYAKGEDGIDQHLGMHPVDDDGLADLHTINPAWENQAKWRIEYMVERGLTVRYIWNDQSSVNGWFKHWLNQDNNKGWESKPTYDDRYGWFKWVHAETYTREECTDERREWYRSTGKYIISRRQYVTDNILKPFKQYIIWDNNEVDAGGTWHDQEADYLNDVPMGKWQRITSVRGVEWFHTRNSIPKRWMIEVHGVTSAAKFQEKLDFLASPYVDKKGNTHQPVSAVPIPSMDGLGENWINKLSITEIVKILRMTGQIQGNSEGRWTAMNPKIYEIGAAMRDVILEGR